MPTLQILRSELACLATPDPAQKSDKENSLNLFMSPSHLRGQGEGGSAKSVLTTTMLHYFLSNAPPCFGCLQKCIKRVFVFVSESCNTWPIVHHVHAWLVLQGADKLAKPNVGPCESEHDFHVIPVKGDAPWRRSLHYKGAGSWWFPVTPSENRSWEGAGAILSSHG